MPMIPFLALAVLLQVPAAREDSPPALYLIENLTSDQGLVETRDLVRLSMDREGKLVKETLISRDQRFFGHFGGHQIALRNFIVTKYGGVIDIDPRKVIQDEHDGEVLGLEGEKIFYLINNTFRSSGLFSFDLKERKVAKVEKGGHWDLPGLKSPDKRMSIATESFDQIIRLYRLDEAPRELGEVNITYSQYSSAFPGKVSCLWLDDGRILVVQTNRKLVILTIRGVEEASIEVKDATTEIVSPPRLWRDPLGRVIYSCGREEFLIDVPDRVASPLKNYSLGYGFEMSVADDQERRRTITSNGKVIGQWVCNPHEARVSPGLLAFPYVRPEKNANLGYPDGVAVWNADVGEWRTIEMWVDDLIGWSK